MVTVAPASETPAAERKADAVAAGTIVPGLRTGSLAAAAVVTARIVIVVTQPEEPDQPDDQQADVEDAESDHEDPPLGGH
jgi:hypothetical protein